MIPAILRAHLQGPNHNAMVGGTAHHMEQWHAKLHREGKRVMSPLAITEHERTQPFDHPIEEARSNEQQPPATGQALASRRSPRTRRLHLSRPSVVQARGWGDGTDIEEWP